MQVVLAGVGGQGILFVTKLLVESAVAQGRAVLNAETLGMSQRGGSVTSHLKVGDYSSPMVREGNADVLLAFETDEAYRNAAYLKPARNGAAGGRLFVNTSSAFPRPEVREHLAAHGIQIHTLDADRLAGELDAPQVTNLVMLGYVSRHQDLFFSLGSLEGAVRAICHSRLVDINIRALRCGYESSAGSLSP